MSEEYGAMREEAIDGMHDCRPQSHFDIVASLAERIVKIAEEKTRELQKTNEHLTNRSQELWNLIGFILYPHTHEEITRYANNLKHRLMEEK